PGQRQGNDDGGPRVHRARGRNRRAGRRHRRASGRPLIRGRSTWLTPLPETLRAWHPACLLATWFGSGLMPYTPATFGSAAALPFGWFIQLYAGPAGLLAAAAAVFALGLWASAVYV